MTAIDPKLVTRVVGWQVVFTVLVAGLGTWLAPRLLLLPGPVEQAVAVSLPTALLCGGTVSWIRTWWSLRRHRYVLRALAIGSRVEPFEMEALEAQILRTTLGWVLTGLLALVLLGTVLRPALMDATTAAGVSLLGVVMLVVSALPMHVLIRSCFLAVIELADPKVMSELVEAKASRGELGHSLTRRLVMALVTPTVFAAIGSSLVASAHLIRADERQREETARALARAALESQPGAVAGSGIDEARSRAAELGFSAIIRPVVRGYQLERVADGMIELTAPLDQGSATVRFSGSTRPLLTAEYLLVALLATLLSGLLGVVLGHELNRDLRLAAAGVEELTRGDPSQHMDSLRSLRFRMVAELGEAIDQLAARFRVFAHAQRQALQAREAAVRARGLFFASVSHDLKSPLNAILGFSELVRQTEPLNPAQRESLEILDRRARELLALIETILDSARVEAGQLVLLREPVTLEWLLRDAAEKGRDLGGDSPWDLRCTVEPGAPLLELDRTRISRALSTFVGHALRTSEEGPVELKGRDRGDGRVEIEVVLPRQQGDDPLDRLLTGRQSSAQIEQRGLALGLGLARAVIELHGGSVRAEERGTEGRAFVICLPVGGRPQGSVGSGISLKPEGLGKPAMARDLP